MTPEKSPNETNLISWARNLKEQLDCYMREYDEADKDLIADYNCRIRNAKELLTLILEMLDKHNIAEVVLIKVEIRKALEILEGDAK